MRGELEATLQQFGEFLLKAQLVKDKAAPYCVGWVRRFLRRPASNEPPADQVRQFCDELEQTGGCQDWQARQAEQPSASTSSTSPADRLASATAQPIVDEHGRTNPLAALEQLRLRIRTRHYSYRTECSYTHVVKELRNPARSPLDLLRGSGTR